MYTKQSFRELYGKDGNLRIYVVLYDENSNESKVELNEYCKQNSLKVISLYGSGILFEEVKILDLDLKDYKNAPSGIGPLAGQWNDKPHRLLYDLIEKLEKGVNS